jgi:hypothetical protein
MHDPPFTAGGLMTPFRSRLFALAFVALSSSRVVAAQDRPNVVLLRRVAEAVDGRRDLAEAWVVVRYDSNTVVDVLNNRAEAIATSRRIPRSDVMGPFNGLPTIPEPPEILPGCVHNGLSMWRPRGMCPELRIPMADVDSLMLRIKLRDGTVRTFPMARGVDALFLTMSAIDKFVIPYYTRIIGPDAAAAMRQDILGRR